MKIKAWCLLITYQHFPKINPNIFNSKENKNVLNEKLLSNHIDLNSQEAFIGED